MKIKRSDEKAKPSISSKDLPADKASALRDDELEGVAGGTTFRVNAETDESKIVDVYKKTLPGK